MSPTIADVARDQTDALRALGGGWLPYRVERVLRDLSQCRTAALGGHLYVCTSCGVEVPVYNSCQNRHCPQCQSRARNRWLEARMDDLLPVPYFHVVFTVPAELRPLFRLNAKTLYHLLFRSAWEALEQLVSDPNRLGARPGALAVLHTWSQTLELHPHIHMVVPGGGLDVGGRWIPSRPKFLVHVKALSRLFSGRFLQALERGVRRGEIRLPDHMEASPSLWLTTIESLRSRRWVVYAKPPFGGPKAVLRYLARYTHRVAIGNPRLVAYDDERVTFRYKKRSSDAEWKTMTLDAVEFLRRFTLHVLPPGFVRIRYFGFLANRNRREAVARCREQLGVELVEPATVREEDVVETSDPLWSPRCPVCEQRRMLEIEGLPRHRRPPTRGPPS